MHDILVIDDDAATRYVLGRILEEAGYRVTTAENGNEGITRFRERPVPVVLCDLFMPVKDGLETIRELREQYPGVKIIVVSGKLWSGLNYARTAERFGADCVLEKPVSRPALIEAVATAIAAA